MLLHFKHLYTALTEVTINRYILTISISLSLCVLVSIGISYALHIQYAYWAGYACVRIMTDNKTMTYKRGLMRCIGTMVALITVVICTSLFSSNISIIGLIVFLLLISMAMAYYFSEFSYFFIMFSVTLGLFFYPYIIFSKQVAVSIIIDRSLVTLIGVLCVCVIILPFLKTKKIAKSEAKKHNKERYIEMTMFSVFFILALAFVFAITIPFKNVLLFEQSLIGVVAVMSSFEHFQIRHSSIQRFLGCLIGLLVPFILTMFEFNIIIVLIISFVIIILFGIIQLQSKYIANMGAQANLCFLSSIYTNGNILQIQGGYERLSSTLVTSACIIFVSFLYFFLMRLTASYTRK